MPDRRRRAALLTSPAATAGWYPQPVTAPGAVLLPRERSSSSAPDSAPAGSGRGGRDDRDDNPFAPPPAGAPDQEWRPRPHLTGHAREDGGEGDGGNGEGRPGQPPAWGSQWSSRQPGRQSGGFGSRPGRGGGQGGPGGPGGQGGGPGGLRWDPTDPLQRRARYALLAGMWAFFFVLFSLPEVALLLGALSLYWGISALRGKPEPKQAASGGAAEGRPAGGAASAPGRPGGAPGAPGVPGPGVRPQTTAAVAGLVAASLALMMVAATFTVQLVYRPYFTCVNDALTRAATKSCEQLLPPQLRPLLSQQQP
ncbi:hypothetical protein ADL22_23940 [Streptomyces sp. NRRL F-4489]|uniref:hypothetical protein n=1 Tax=Streptomyces sp. NRRL F-4489 TaxID=1609095 RepID=UPI00074910E2|nr:hypothetical protein [Streptomyces sp. NRRL F-4489]KUL36508.1 hypothetical protein ADL22_23940 [Streptomyces sp. NRRL F-4489]